MKKQTYVLMEATAIAASLIGDDVEIPEGNNAVAYLDLSVFSGTTELLDVIIQEKDPKSGKYFLIGTFAQLSAVGSERIVTTDINALRGSIIRANATIGGTSVAATFTVTIVIS